jgi:hypothetical protein
MQMSVYVNVPLQGLEDVGYINISLLCLETNPRFLGYAAPNLLKILVALSWLLLLLFLHN